MAEDIALRALVYAGDPEDHFPQVIVVVSSTSSVEDVFHAFEAKITSNTVYHGWQVIEVWKVRSYPDFSTTLRAENAI
jgi:hypothetical protein